jgi:hypothetical protein
VSIPESLRIVSSEYLDAHDDWVLTAKIPGWVPYEGERVIIEDDENNRWYKGEVISVDENHVAELITWVRT